MIWARQAIDAEALEKDSRWFRDVADAGIALNAARCSALQKKRHAMSSGVPLASFTASLGAVSSTCSTPGTGSAMRWPADFRSLYLAREGGGPPS